ncbi:Cytosolic sulfotransferase 17 [Linum grandiflorum]
MDADRVPHLQTPTHDKEPCWVVKLTEIQGFWYHTPLRESIDAFRANFRPKPDDNVVILASSMKTGTTWLKALSHCILFRDDKEEDCLTKMSPHLCVPSLEAGVYLEDPSSRKNLEQGRLFNTHIPYSYLPDSIKKDCKVVYITRDPKDTLVSQWHFFNKIFKGNIQHPLPLERAADIFCNGRIPYGPYWEHVLEYWEASRASPDKVMFVKYEDLRRDPKLYVRKLALFLGKPFGDGDKDDVEVEKTKRKAGCSTHMPYSYLPDSIKKDCKLVYITRDLKDTLVSQWHFFNKIYNIHQPLTLERAAELFCDGRIPYGPYWEHVLEYWEASQTSSEKVMFVKYEDLRRDPKPYVRKLASFRGKPLVDGGNDVEVEKIIWRSSFDRLRDLDVNKTGKSTVVPHLTNNLFFRRGEVGDWSNHLTAEMAKRIYDITSEKFRSTGLYLDEDEAI